MKVAVAKAAAKVGFYHIDADAVAKKCTEKGSPLLECIEEAFEGTVIDGELSREKLAKAAFSSPEETQKMNEIMLPFIVGEIEKIIKEVKKEGENFILLDAPTLFESGADRLCDVTAAVLSDKETLLKRIMARDSISKSAALLRINAGKPDQYYSERCDYIIRGKGEIEEFSSAAENFFSKIKKEGAEK